MKKVLALVLALMMIFAVSASAKELSEIKIGYILKPESNEYWSSMKAGVLAWAEEKGVQVDIQCVDDESNFTGQLEMMENMINMGYDAICAAPLSANNLVSGAVKASQAGIPVINVDENIDLAAVIAEGGNMAGHYTTDNIIVGQTGGNYIAEQIGEGQVAIISGTDGNVTSNNRVAGATQAFEATGLELVAVQNGDWDRMIAMDAATNIMTTYPELKAFYCANDTMALGVYEAVLNAGKAEQVIVVGTDAVQGAKESVRDGGMAATVGQDNIGIGIACGELALELALAGDWKVDPAAEQCVTQYIDCFLVTADNAADYL